MHVEGGGGTVGSTNEMERLSAAFETPTKLPPTDLVPPLTKA